MLNRLLLISLSRAPFYTISARTGLADRRRTCIVTVLQRIAYRVNVEPLILFDHQ